MDQDATTDYPPVSVRLWGDLACFTRPEMKVERVSYPIMTPSAARGALEAIFWRPTFRFQVREIWLLSQPRYISFLRNEVKDKMTVPPKEGYVYLADEHRTQRHTLALRNPAYLVRADILLTDPASTEDTAKYRDQFRRRVDRGQCFHTPYLGCREFVASFSSPREGERALPIDLDLGPVLLDMEYAEAEPRITPHFFQARLEQGIMPVPPISWRAAVSWHTEAAGRVA